MNEEIVISVDDGLLELQIDRPDKKNAMTAAMYRGLIAGLQRAASDPAVFAVLIAGVGETFCAGNDLKDFLSGPEGGAAAFEFIRTIVAFDKPIVAAVQGAAVGIGATMLFHCDLVYASPDARFSFPFINLGLVPEAGSSLLAPAMFGHARAAGMLLLGEPLGAEAAERHGFVTEVVPRSDLLAYARSKAAVLGTKPPHSLVAIRRLLKFDTRMLTDRIELEMGLFNEALSSDESKEAFAAFFEKRPSNFSRH